ncbi:Endo-1,4-beta-xylanase, GH35 family [Lutibacter agarilyticus]|uniref:endo-1,4-beta-xylanase n=2 Tax=Lutibacter agarilyticus TaxID=1109740 RepID=A0A238Z530_9FLAO|nr:Endo-1,4-beta-xylanase, GH35 family [Lutibacter agarilyticus]
MSSIKSHYYKILNNMRIKEMLSVLIIFISLCSSAQTELSVGGLKDVNSSILIGATLQSGFPDAKIIVRSEDSKLGKLFLKEFNLGQTTCYPAWETWKGVKKYDFTQFNAVVNWYTKHKVPVVAHLLAGPDQYFPDWFKKATYTNAELDSLLSDYIKAVISSNNNSEKVKYWNVVNEFIYNNGSYTPPNLEAPKIKFVQLGMEPDKSGLTGEDKVNDSHPIFVRKAFEYARKYTNGKLELRDYNIEFWGTKKSKGFYQMVRHLLNSEVPIDAIGLQGHFKLNKTYDWDKLKQTIQEYRKLGLEVYITELDFADEDKNWNDEKAQFQKEQYKQMMTAIVDGGANWVCFWGLRDNWNKHWLYEKSPLLFDFDLNQKPAYLGVKEALQHSANKFNIERQTVVSIEGDQFYINGKPTYEGRYWKGHKVEGLLINSRMVQGIFDDINPKTSTSFAYPDTNKWDTERNNREFVEAMPEWKSYGLNSFTLNMQGGSPVGYKGIPYTNPGFYEDGSLREPYMKRLDAILKKADELEMLVILGIFYFRQDQYLKDEAAIINATTNLIDWLFKKNYRNVLIEICNETNDNGSYEHNILRPSRVAELIHLVKNKKKNGYRYLVTTSFGGITVPNSDVIKASDFLLIHGNGAKKPERLIKLAKDTRKAEGYRKMPIINNEDDHFDFDKATNNFTTSIETYVSWGYLDFRFPDETDFNEGYQSIPVDWGINSDRKKGFFNKVKEITGGN